MACLTPTDPLGSVLCFVVRIYSRINSPRADHSFQEKLFRGDQCSSNFDLPGTLFLMEQFLHDSSPHKYTIFGARVALRYISQLRPDDLNLHICVVSTS